MTDWHVQNNFTNPVHLNHFLPHGQRSAYLLWSVCKILIFDDGLVHGDLKYFNYNLVNFYVQKQLML